MQSSILLGFGLMTCVCVFSGCPEPAESDSCTTYCDQVFDVCNGSNEIFESRQSCLNACSGYAQSGNVGDTEGNTVQCRLQHLEYAVEFNLPEVHCPHAAADGGGECVNTQDPCNLYCASVAEACNLDSTRQYESNAACLNACQSFGRGGMKGDVTENTISCRMTFLNDPPAELSTADACKAAGADSMSCVSM